MEKEYLEFIRQLMEQRGIGGIITRKELVGEMVRRYKPGAFHKPNSILRGGVETCLGRLRHNGFLEICGRGENKILKMLPDMSYLEFIAKYPTKYHANRK